MLFRYTIHLEPVAETTGEAPVGGIESSGLTSDPVSVVMTLLKTLSQLAKMVRDDTPSDP